MTEERREARSFEMLGRAIRVLRTEQGLNRKELARATGISYPYLTEIEAGKKSPSTSVISQIAEFFGVEPHELLARADQLAAGGRGWDRDALTRQAPERSSAVDAPRAPRGTFALRAPMRPRALEDEPAGAQASSSSEREELRALLRGAIARLDIEDLRRLADLAARMVE